MAIEDGARDDGDGEDEADDEEGAVDPNDPFERAWAALEDERFEDAIDIAQATLDRGVEDDEDAADLHYVIGLSSIELGEPEAAFDAYQAALELTPDDPVVLAGLGEAEHELWRFDDAVRTLKRSIELAGDDPHAHRSLAETLDRLGRHKEAEKHFARAQTLDPEGYPRPFRVNRRTFDDLVKRAIDELPTPIKSKLGELRFEVHDYPEPVQVQLDDGPGSPRTLGFFHATPFPEQWREAVPTYSPQHILVFQRNLEHVVSDRAELDEEVRTTIIHEVGHFLGLDEDELEEMGLA